MILKAPSAPIYTSFEGEACAEKRVLTFEIFQKFPKNAFFGLFSNMCLRRRIFGQITIFTMVKEESSENQYSRPKKKNMSTNFFLKIRPPPLEKFFGPRLLVINICNVMWI